jgi:hypothetical protein
MSGAREEFLTFDRAVTEGANFRDRKPFRVFGVRKSGGTSKMLAILSMVSWAIDTSWQ